MEKTQEKSFEQMNWEVELLNLFIIVAPSPDKRTD